MRRSALPTFLLLATLLALFTTPLHGQVETAIDQAEAWLVGAQNPDGSFDRRAGVDPGGLANRVKRFLGRLLSAEELAGLTTGGDIAG